MRVTEQVAATRCRHRGVPRHWLKSWWQNSYARFRAPMRLSAGHRSELSGIEFNSLLRGGASARPGELVCRAAPADRRFRLRRARLRQAFPRCALERTNADQAIELTPEQAAFLEKLNPCFKERHVESERPGELLSADTFMVGTLKGIGRVYLHAVVDTFGSYAFGFLHVSKQPEAAVAVLHNDVLPFYQKLDLPVQAILTDNGREFCGTERHPYELYLALNEIEHRKTKVGSPRTNGFVERFNGTVLEEFFRPTMR